jgi:hypothetical protein
MIVYFTICLILFIFEIMKAKRNLVKFDIHKFVKLKSKSMPDDNEQPKLPPVKVKGTKTVKRPKK